MKATFLVFTASAQSTHTSASPPNLLLFIADQWRWDWAGFDEANLFTPHIQELAAKGVRFTHAYVPSPICVPSRGAFAAGIDYDDSPLTDNGIDFPVDGSLRTVYQQLQEAGYHTMLAGKDHLTERTGVGLDGQYHASALGFDDAIRTMDKYEFFVDPQHPTEPYGAWLAEKGMYATQAACYGFLGEGTCCDDIVEGHLQGFHCPGTEARNDLQIDDWVQAQAEIVLRRKPAGKPWFLQVGFPSPHPPFILTPRMNASMWGRSFPLAHDSANFSAEMQQTSRQEYAALVENVDVNIGKVLDLLRTSGELGNTVVVVLGDHGDQLGDHDRFEKMVHWDGSSRVPLVFAGPGIENGGRVLDVPVTTLDVAGTLLDLAGATRTPRMTTRSLRPLLTGAAISSVRDIVHSGLTRERGGFNWRMVLRRFNATAVLKLVCCPTGCPRALTHRQVHEPEVFLFNVHGNGEAQGYRGDVLSRATREAQELVQHLAPSFRAVCEPLIARKTSGWTWPRQWQIYYA